MKYLLLVVSLFALGGCASTSTEYYQAVEKAAQANAAASKAKFDALSAIAASGDGQAASAAVMALAMSSTPHIQPVPQQSQAIQWASILATPVTSLGMMWMQADSAKTMAQYNAQVDLARVKATSADNQALYGSFVNAHAITGDVANTGLTQMGTSLGNVDFTPFIDGMVTLGTAGIDGAVNLGTEGFDTNAEIAVAGFNQIGATAEDGLNVAANISNNAMTNLVTLGTNGLTNLHSLGKLGMEGIWMTNKDWLEYATATNKGCVITTDDDGKVVVTCN